MKERLKVGDKNKLGKRRKLIIHNRQFTWMSTTEIAKVKKKKKKKCHFLAEEFSALPPRAGSIYLVASEVRDATRYLLMKVKASNDMTLPFIFDPHAGNSARQPLRFRLQPKRLSSEM